jgi:hypothetical protein
MNILPIISMKMVGNPLYETSLDSNVGAILNLLENSENES